MSTQKLIPFAVIALLMVSTALTLTSGIWADEVSYKIILERYFITGGFREGLLPFCSDEFLVVPPMVLVPAAALWAQLTLLGSSWFSYRLIPYACLVIVLLVLIRYNLQKKNRSFWPLLLFVTLGTMPFAIILLRPEAIILASCMILFFVGRRMIVEQRCFYLYLYGVAALLLYSAALYVHPKSVYLIAVPAISILLSGMKPASRMHLALYRTTFLVGLLSLTYAAISFDQRESLTCQALPQIREKLNAYSTNPLDIFNNPVRFVSSLQLAFSPHSIGRTLSLLLYRAGFDADFLPQKLATTFFDFGADILIALALVTITMFVAVKFLICLLRKSDTDERKEFYLIASVLAALIVPYVLSVEKAFYEVACFGWTMMIGAVLLWPLNPIMTANHRWIKTGTTAALMALSVACIFLSYNNFTRPPLDGYRGWGVVPYSVDMNALDLSIGEMLTESHIGLKEPLVVSDLTYEAVKYHPYVVRLDYMNWGFMVPGATKTYMERLDIRYGVVECELLKPGKEFPAQLLMTRRFTQTRYDRTQKYFDICLFRVNYI
jgi:hypothetical protein